MKLKFLSIFLSLVLFAFSFSPSFAFQVLDVPFPPPQAPNPPSVPSVPNPPKPPGIPDIPPIPSIPTIPDLPKQPTPTPTVPVGGPPQPTPTPTTPITTTTYATPSYGTPSYGTPSYGTPSYGTPATGGAVLGLAATGSLFTIEALTQDFQNIFSAAGFISSIETEKVKALTQEQETNEPLLLPTRITIPKLHVDLSVTPSEVVEGYWEISNRTASYGLGSGVPGKSGNTVIFAHNWLTLFGPLANIKKEEEIVVTTEDGTYTYIVKDLKLVTPDSLDVIAPTDDETLTLYTCAGKNDEQRLVVTAKRV